LNDITQLIAGLSNEEKKVLKRLSQQGGGPVTVSSLEDDDLSSVAINRAALGLEAKSLITVNESTKTHLFVTEAGRELREEVPERTVGRKVLEQGNSEAFLDELGVDKQTSGIALGWLRKRGWATIAKEDGKVKIVLTQKGIDELSSPSWIQQLLAQIEDGALGADDITAEQLSVLKGRKAIDTKEERTRFFSLTEQGAQVASHDLQVREEVTQITPELLRDGAWRACELKRFNVEAPVRRIYGGKKQPYLAFLDGIKQRLVALGFTEMRGPLIESEFWNFDALFQPQNHPARDWTDTYRLICPSHGHLPPEDVVQAVKSSHERAWRYNWQHERARTLMPRAHGTCLSARQLFQGIDIPGKYFSIARCFRPDVLDKTHLVEFNQIEGIICDPSLTFRNLLGILEQFALEIAGAEGVRFYPDYYPFTEPSVQMSAKHHDLGWVEFGGAGIFRKELTEPLGVDIPVIAWGLGVDRLAMFKLGIDDIRYLFSDDIQWLRDEEMI
jgi:phenylalanyl-tRNA synthetase alpha chain